MSVERRTIAGWCHQLNAPGAELTLSEFMARCLLDIRENLLNARLATEHVEGMLGSLDHFMAEQNGAYHAITAARSRPVAPELAARRDGGS